MTEPIWHGNTSGRAEGRWLLTAFAASGISLMELIYRGGSGSLVKDLARVARAWAKSAECGVEVGEVSRKTWLGGQRVAGGSLVQVPARAKSMECQKNVYNNDK